MVYFKDMTPAKRGFTFIEILVVVALLATLVVILVLILNPAEYLRRSRDSQRLQDYTRISQAMNLYAYNTALSSREQDFDGPPFPITGSPPLTDSCKNDPVPHRLFVSVPSDNGEGSPTPPLDWVYTRVTSTQLRKVDGTGWLPVDFTEGGGSSPISVLPVDPINSFNSGFYYSYTCGSYELNLRFESAKYRELASSDGGSDANIYEIGTDLNIQPKHYPTSTAVAGTLTLTPDGPGTYEWSVKNPIASNAYDIVSNTNDADYIATSTLGSKATFALTNATATFSNVEEIRVYVMAAKCAFCSNTSITPILLLGGTLHNGSLIDLTSTIMSEGVATFSGTPFNTWGPTDINALEAGVVLSGTAEARVTKIRVEVDYQ